MKTNHVALITLESLWVFIPFSFFGRRTANYFHAPTKRQERKDLPKQQAASVSLYHDSFKRAMEMDCFELSPEDFVFRNNIAGTSNSPYTQ